MVIEEVTRFSPVVLDLFQKLIPQLSRSAKMPSEAYARSIIESGSTRLLIAIENETVLGMLTLVVFPIPTGVRAWIEDVVVDAEGRGRGVGAALSQRALSIAQHEGAKTVDLTSRPSREAANQLYRKVGFAERNTNVYRYTFESN